MRHFVKIVILVLFSLKETTGQQNESAEVRLLKDLLIGTRPDVRPVRNVSEPVIVHMDMVYIQMGELFWETPFLVWDPRKYEGLDILSLKPSEMWIPDITLYNVINKNPEKSLFNAMDTNIIVRHDGQIKWLAPAVLKTDCYIAVRYFPFDTQTCIIKMGSWVHNSQLVDFRFKEETRTKADQKTHHENNEWKIISIQQELTLEKFSCCPVPFSTFTYTVKVRRRASYYVVNLFLPCGIISSIALFSFFLPPDSGERVSLVLAILLSMTVYMTVIAEKMPISSEVVPILSIFFVVKLVNIALILVVTCLIIRFRFKAGQPPASVAYIVNQKLAKIVGLKKNVEKRKPSLKLERNHKSIREEENLGYRVSQRIQDKNERNVNAETNTLDNETTTLEKEGSVKEALEKKEMAEQMKDTWPFAARVLNRLCFAFFFLNFLFSFFMIFIFIPFNSSEQ